MTDAPNDKLGQTLIAADQGDPQATKLLLPLLYDELKKLALHRLGRAPAGTTLQPTALVHEVYLRLAGDGDPGWNNRGHFFGAAARAMRNILCDRARQKRSLKRGGDCERIDVEIANLALDDPSEDILALDHALTELEQADPRKAQIVMLRYFAGMTMREISEVLDISVPTVEREWRFTRTLLFAQLSDSSLTKSD